MYFCNPSDLHSRGIGSTWFYVERAFFFDCLLYVRIGSAEVASSAWQFLLDRLQCFMIEFTWVTPSPLRWPTESFMYPGRFHRFQLKRQYLCWSQKEHSQCLVISQNQHVTEPLHLYTRKRHDNCFKLKWLFMVSFINLFAVLYECSIHFWFWLGGKWVSPVRIKELVNSNLVNNCKCEALVQMSCRIFAKCVSFPPRPTVNWSHWSSFIYFCFSSILNKLNWATSPLLTLRGFILQRWL